MYSIDIAKPGDDFLAVKKRFPGRLLAKTADVTKEDSITTVVEAIVEESSALHGMVVNAGRTKSQSCVGLHRGGDSSTFQP